MLGLIFLRLSFVTVKELIKRLSFEVIYVTLKIITLNIQSVQGEVQGHLTAPYSC